MSAPTICPLCGRPARAVSPPPPAVGYRRPFDPKSVLGIAVLACPCIPPGQMHLGDMLWNGSQWIRRGEQPELRALPTPKTAKP